MAVSWVFKIMVDRKILNNFSDKLLFSAVIGAIVPVERLNTTRNNI